MFVFSSDVGLKVDYTDHHSCQLGCFLVHFKLSWTYTRLFSTCL